MATYENGITGAFTGRVGAVVGVNWKGKNVMRARPRKRTAPLTANERRHRTKFALVNHFVAGVIDLVNSSFHSERTHQTGFNKAFSYNMKNAVVVADNKPAMDFSMVLLGQGDLPNPESLLMDLSSPGKITFNWKDNSGRGRAVSSDLAYVAIYNPDKRNWQLKSKVAERSVGHCTFDLSDDPESLVWHIYFGFVSADEKESGNSVYLGTIQA